MSSTVIYISAVTYVCTLAGMVFHWGWASFEDFHLSRWDACHCCWVEGLFVRKCWGFFSWLGYHLVLQCTDLLDGLEHCCNGWLLLSLEFLQLMLDQTTAQAFLAISVFQSRYIFFQVLDFFTDLLESMFGFRGDFDNVVFIIFENLFDFPYFMPFLLHFAYILAQFSLKWSLFSVTNIDLSFQFLHNQGQHFQTILNALNLPLTTTTMHILNHNILRSIPLDKIALTRPDILMLIIFWQVNWGVIPDTTDQQTLIFWGNSTIGLWLLTPDHIMILMRLPLHWPLKYYWW